MLENVDDPAVMVEPLNDNCTDVLLVLSSDVKKAVEYVPVLLRASGSANLKVFTEPFRFNKKDCQLTATSLRMGGKDTSDCQ